ncbi:hypothetical protein [Marinobacterium sp. MBR-109]|uniref:hypothetical protein n=1 Tax=Marinobacterium sp. MBR-109 TaxID=3156462 RepID=UPI003395B69E
MTTNYFEQLKSELEAFRSLSSRGGHLGFFGQEVLRFHSIAGTLVEGCDFRLDESANTDERYFTHILVRSLLENYFWTIYLFDDSAQTSNRYEELKNSFKRDYVKLLNENHLPHKDQLEPADPSWSALPRVLDVNSMMAQSTNDYGDRLNYLYFVYRITSFDTHGKNLGAIFQDVFGKTCNFPVLKIGYTIELMANQYLVVLQELRSRDEI